MSQNDSIKLESINDDLFAQLSGADQAQLIGGGTNQGSVKITAGPSGPDAEADYQIDFGTGDDV